MKDPKILLNNSSEFRFFLAAWESDRETRILRTPGSSPGFIIAEAYQHSPRPFLVVVPDEREAERLQRELAGFISIPVLIFPACEILAGDEEVPDPVIQGERQAILARLITDRSPPLLITTTSALTDDLPPPKKYAKSILSITAGIEIAPVKLIKRLVDQGYENQNPVMERGRFTRRGGIIDIYPGNLDYPVRIELEGDMVDSLRQFDPQTQRSRGPLERLNIYSRAGEGIATIFDYLPDDCRLFRVGSFSPEAGEKFDLARMVKPVIIFGPDMAHLDRLVGGSELRFSISTLEKFKYQDPGIKYPLLDMFTEWLSSGYRVLIYGHNPGETERLEEILTEKGFYPHKNLWLVTGELDQGFIWDEPHLVVLGDSEIFSRYRIPRPRRKYTAKIPALPRADFHPGDFVVHLDHGVGKFLGIRNISSEGQEREMLVIGYAEGARLYLNLTQSHLVSRYLGAGKANPKLDRLGGSRWLRVKIRAERAVKDLAGDLLELQAHRAATRGHSFPPDTAWQKEFEDAFIYQETEEQARAIIEVKEDMEAKRPMDRLLCGDVGYGKTEVAVRAAFKAVMDGKQTAILVPTTVLAQQHLRTFRDRISDYPVRVEALSRLVSPKEQAKIIADLTAGAVDIVIGTHRLLQNDIAFKSLGLVIIDEEQRFGVRHKEKLKRMKKLVDVLTLTATPIPRTLYLSLTGARDLSSITTPPQDRLAVETRVMPYNPEVVRTAIRREVERGGQIFYLHNRVKDIETVRSKLEIRFPDLKIAVGHGQMDDKELAGVMEEFAAGTIDLLVCTTIIESGLDIPNANTIIIENAHRFGLADLYQLRGRVGRYKHRAYAYFFYPPAIYLEDGARKRLRAIEEFSHLGAGYGLALRDLEIRGAGNILGREQHGHIAAVGFDLYCRLLRESVSRLRGEEPTDSLKATIDFDLQVTIPLDYAGTESQRLEIYRTWSGIASQNEVKLWLEELRDRFGPLPEEAKAMAAIAGLKLAAAKKGIDSIRWIQGRFAFFRKEKVILAWPGNLPDSSKALSRFARAAMKKCREL